MLRRVAKISMSSEVLETHSTSTPGPVISVSSVSGALTREMPVRSTLPDACDGAEELTPACDGGLAAYVHFATSGGCAATSSPSFSCAFCPGESALRYHFVHFVRAIGHSFSNRNR